MGAVDMEDGQVGRRVREVRQWRRMNLEVVAGIAGISTSYLSLIERGKRPVTTRQLLESIAAALRVSPAELTGRPYAPSDADSVKVSAAMAAMTDAVTGWRVGETPDVSPRPWHDVRADLTRLTQQLRPESDYAGQAEIVPGLIRHLLAGVAIPDCREEALVGLLETYHAVVNMAGKLGVPGLSTLATERMNQVAQELGDSAHIGLAAWARAHALSGTNRARQYDLAVAVADDEQSRTEVRGMANLTAALASAAQNQTDAAESHLSEAAKLAERIEPDVSPWGQMQFGRTNVGIWRVAIGVELGQGAKVAEIAANVHAESITKSRRGAFYIDLGRGLISDRKTRSRGIVELMRAEKIAPQQFSNNVFARETVASLLYSARREAGGRELRYLAWRLGIPPTG